MYVCFLHYGLLVRVVERYVNISSASESRSDIEDVISYVEAIEHIKQIIREHRVLCQTQQHTSDMVWVNGTTLWTSQAYVRIYAVLILKYFVISLV